MIAFLLSLLNSMLLGAFGLGLTAIIYACWALVALLFAIVRSPLSALEMGLELHEMWVLRTSPYPPDFWPPRSPRPVASKHLVSPPASPIFAPSSPVWPWPWAAPGTAAPTIPLFTPAEAQAWTTFLDRFEARFFGTGPLAGTDLSRVANGPAPVAAAPAPAGLSAIEDIILRLVAHGNNFRAALAALYAAGQALCGPFDEQVLRPALCDLRWLAGKISQDGLRRSIDWPLADLKRLHDDIEDEELDKGTLPDSVGALFADLEEVYSLLGLDGLENF